MMRFKAIRALAVAAALGLVAVACSQNGGGEQAEQSQPNTEKFPYKTALFSDIKNPNYWNYLNAADVWTGFVIGSTKCALWQTEAPSQSVIPDVAAQDWADAPVEEQEDGTWAAEVKLQENVEWSDGEPLTAEDLVFTYETVKASGLTQNWEMWTPVEKSDDRTGVMAVEAVDEKTVRFVFNKRPGLATWPFNVGQASIMPEHFWADKAEKALQSEDPAAALAAEKGDGDPSCGPVIYDEWEKGSYASTTPNDNWHLEGTKVTHFADGGAEVVNKKAGLSGVYGGSGEGEQTESYEIGPYLEEEIMTVYGDQNAAVLELRQGNVDFLYNSLGMERGLQEQVVDNPDLQSITNPSYGLRYVAFDHRNAPMNDKAFRQALATQIDKNELVDKALGGVPNPFFTAMPEGNEAWYDAEAAKPLIEKYSGSETERLQKAVQILKDAGYSWEKEPAVVDGEIEPGSPIMMPNGEPMREIEFQHPTGGYDPLRATAALWIVDWAEELGIPLKSKPTEFQQLTENVDNGEFDMYLLGFSFGSPAFPDHYETFWATDGGWNQSFYSNEEYDAIVDRYMNAETLEEAKTILWEELEPMVEEELPWIVLFDAPILEFYRSEGVQYPYVDLLDGIQGQNGFKSTVMSAE